VDTGCNTQLLPQQVFTYCNPQEKPVRIWACHNFVCCQSPCWSSAIDKPWVVLMMANILIICFEDKAVERRESLAGAIRARCQAVTMDTMRKRFESRCQCYSCTTWYHQRHIKAWVHALASPHLASTQRCILGEAFCMVCASLLMLSIHPR
jgi:hypothetical protein